MVIKNKSKKRVDIALVDVPTLDGKIMGVILR
jgi:hypothetical protein